MAGPWTIRATFLAERRKAMRLSLAAAKQSASELERHVNAFMAYAQELGLSLDRQWVALDGDQPQAACTCIESPGKTAMLFLTAGGVLGARSEVIADLARVACRYFGESPLLVQALIAPDDDQNRAALREAGFRDLAVLRYLERPTAWNDAVTPRPPAEFTDGSLVCQTYDDPGSHADFRRLILDTYTDSLDCPGLAGLRGIDDILLGHQAAGRFDARRWMLLRRGDTPVGVLLLNENPLRSALDLVYTGVHPRWRHRGLGRYLLSHAIALTAQGEYAALTVAVDEANAPAREMYERQGFIQTTARRALIRPPASSLGATEG